MRRSRILLVLACMITPTLQLAAQVRVDGGHHTRLQRFGRDMAYGLAEGVGFAAIDQARNQPAAWGDGSSGFRKRAASEVGEFVIQESVTEGIAAALKRPLDYTHCHCSGTGARIGHALTAALFDEMPGGAWAFAVPRVAGAYVGAAAQASWMPSTANRTTVALTNGTASLAIGAAINLVHEFIR